MTYREDWGAGLAGLSYGFVFFLEWRPPGKSVND
jgi:hypothetical protein